MEREEDDDVTLVGSSCNNTPTNKNWTKGLSFPSDIKNKRKRKEQNVAHPDQEGGEENQFQYKKSPFKAKYNFKQSTNKQGTSKRLTFKCDSCGSTSGYRYDANNLIDHCNKCAVLQTLPEKKLEVINNLNDYIVKNAECNDGSKKKLDQAKLVVHPKIDNQTKKLILELLVKAMAWGNLPFRAIFKNDYFHQLLNMLNNNFRFGEEATIKLLNNLGISLRQRDNSALLEDYATLTIDGWTDVSRKSIHAVMLQTKTRSTLLKLLEMPGQRHTAKNLFNTVMSHVEDILDNIHAVCTDSPSVMVSFRKMISERHTHILSIPCSAHVVNLISQDIVMVTKEGTKIKECREAVSHSCKLVAYFLNCQYWFEVLERERKLAEIGRRLQTFSKTRWYGLANLLKGVTTHQVVIRKIIFEYKVNQGSHPPLDKKIINIVDNEDFWKQCEQLLEVFSIIAEMIANLEKRETNLSHILPEMITGYIKLKKLRGNQFQEVALESLRKRVQSSFSDGIYLVAMSLIPSYRVCVLAKEKSLKNLIQSYLHLLQKWKIADNVKKRVEEYNGYLRSPTIEFFGGAREYWSTVEAGASFPNLMKVAQRLLSITVHAASVERLFSLLGLQKTKSRNRMKIATLENLAAIKLNLIEEQRQKGNVKDTKSAVTKEGSSLNQIEAYHEINVENDDENDVDAGDIIARLITGEEPSEVQNEIADIWLEEVFNIELFEREEAKRANAESASKNKIVEGVIEIVDEAPHHLKYDAEYYCKNF